MPSKTVNRGLAGSRCPARNEQITFTISIGAKADYLASANVSAPRERAAEPRRIVTGFTGMFLPALIAAPVGVE